MANNTAKTPRQTIAIILTISIVGITIIIAAVALLDDRKEGLDYVAKTLLPLWGTWLGAVIAFYFGKENFDAVTKSYRDVIDKLSPEEKMARVKVEKVMIPVKEIKYLVYNKEKNNKIKDILKYPAFAPFNRYAILDEQKVFQYIIHRSTFHLYIAEKVENGVDPAEINTTTLEDMIGNSSNKIRNLFLKGYNFVSKTDNLLKAKKAMDDVPECQDIFVTETGKPTEPILGLITNNKILKEASN